MSTAEQNMPHGLLEQMLELGKAARAAAAQLAEAPAAAKRAALEAAARELRSARAPISFLSIFAWAEWTAVSPSGCCAPKSHQR